jgi:hypothetical protein
VSIFLITSKKPMQILNDDMITAAKKMEHSGGVFPVSIASMSRISLNIFYYHRYPT